MPKSEFPSDAISIGDLHDITTYQAGVMQAAANWALQKECDEILAPYGITKIQWLIIGSALDAGEQGLKVAGLEKRLGVSAGFLRETLRLLDAHKMLVWPVGKTGRRVRQIYLNPDFAPDCAEIEQSLRSGLRRSIYSNVTPIEFRVYIKVLHQLARL